MKNINAKFRMVLTLIIICFFATNNTYAQVPDAINFQAIARDGNGDILSETPIMIQLSILEGGVNGTQVYREIRSITTNVYGSFSFQIGRNPFISEGDFSTINWASGNKFLKVDYDPTASLSFDLTLGTIEFVTVPYAFAAKEVVFIDASGAIDGDILVFNSSTGKFEPMQPSASPVEWSAILNTPIFADVAISGNYNDLNNTPFVPTDISHLTDNSNLIFDGNYNSLTNLPQLPVDAQPRSAQKTQKLTVRFSGGTDVSFSQSSSTCDYVYANVALVFSQGTQTIYPIDVYYIDNKRFEALFTIPDNTPSGYYNIVLGPNTACPYTLISAFKVH